MKVKMTIPHECIVDNGEKPTTKREKRESVGYNGKLKLSKKACSYLQRTVSTPHIMLEAQGVHRRVSSLVVFLPGAGNGSSEYSRVLQAAAKEGHFVAGISYIWEPNDAMHECVLFGRCDGLNRRQDEEMWTVRRKYSVENVLVEALGKVEWGDRFVNDGKVRWDLVVMSGHSQGASHAAYASMTKHVPAVLLSGPKEAAGDANGWMNGQMKRVVKRKALLHGHEDGANGRLKGNLEHLGLRRFCDIKSLYDECDVVVSNMQPVCRTGRRYDESVAGDRCACGEMDDVWRWLFRHAENRKAMPVPDAENIEKGVVILVVMAVVLVWWVVFRKRHWRNGRFSAENAGETMPLRTTTHLN